MSARYPKKSHKKKFKRRYGRTDDHERKSMPIFDAATRKALDEDARMGFVDTIIRHFDAKKVKPEDIVDEARVYFRKRYERDLERGVTRHSHWLNSTSTALSHIKERLRDLKLAPYPYYREVAISKRELEQLDRLNHRRLEDRVHDQPEVDLSKLLSKLFELLNTNEPELIALGIAGLTGRRQTEVVHSMILSPPKFEQRHRYPSYWAQVTGFSKRRKKDKYYVRSRELPLLAPRETLVAALHELRDMWPSDSHQEASVLYGKTLAEAAIAHLRPLGIRRMHELRKTFIEMAFKHFNERGSVRIAFASHVLGHKPTISKRATTYLIIRTTNMPELEDLFAHANMDDLTPHRAEQHDKLTAPTTETPMYQTPSEEEDEEEPESKSDIEDRSHRHQDLRYGFDKKGRPIKRSASEITKLMQDLKL